MEDNPIYQNIVGQQLGNYHLLQLIGYGGMGAVYKARQFPMNRIVALKVIPNINNKSAQRFLREAQTISQLNHPNLITVYDFGSDPSGYLFLSMAFLEGQTLKERIEEGPKMTIDEIMDVTRQVCMALDHAHEQNIVHRDIKPDNIFLVNQPEGNPQAQVLDFGIVKIINEDSPTLTGDGNIIGTPKYMSPEQVLGQDIDQRSDLYSMGCVLYEMLAGRPPFEGQSTTVLMAQVQEQPKPFEARELPENCPAGIELLVQACLQKNRAMRPTGAKQILMAIETLEKETTKTFDASVLDPIEEPLSWHWYAGAAASAVILCGALFAIYTVLNKPKAPAPPSARDIAMKKRFDRQTTPIIQPKQQPKTDLVVEEKSVEEKAEIALEAKKYDESITLCKVALNSPNVPTSCYGILIEAYHKKGNDEEACRYLKRTELLPKKTLRISLQKREINCSAALADDERAELAKLTKKQVKAMRAKAAGRIVSKPQEAAALCLKVLKSRYPHKSCFKYIQLAYKWTKEEHKACLAYKEAMRVNWQRLRTLPYYAERYNCKLKKHWKKKKK